MVCHFWHAITLSVGHYRAHLFPVEGIDDVVFHLKEMLQIFRAEILQVLRNGDVFQRYAILESLVADAFHRSRHLEIAKNLILHLYIALLQKKIQ